MNQYLVYERVNDEFNKPRSRRLLNPALCMQCGMDVLKEKEVKASFELRFGTSNYNELPPEAKSQVPIEMKHHEDILHRPENQKLLNEDDLPVASRNGVLETQAQRRLADARKAQREMEKKAAIAAKLGILTQQNQPQVIYVQAPVSSVKTRKRTKKTLLEPSPTPIVEEIKSEEEE